MADFKRTRTANFQEREVEALLHIIKKFDGIIECKKTDKVFRNDKEKCWKKIANIFNASSPALIPRSPKDLRGKYENLKKTLNRKIADNKLEIHKIKDGSANSTPLTKSDEMLYSIITLAVEGLPARYDVDDFLDSNFEDKSPDEEAEISDQDVEAGSVVQEQNAQNEWFKWTLQSQQRKRNKKLQVRQNRRKPQNGDIATALLKRKLELAELQCENMRLQNEDLKLSIQLKEKQLLL